MAESLEHVIYDLAQSALEQQSEQVSELRRRAGTLIAAAALSNSVFAALAIEPTGGLGAWEITALAVLGADLGCGLWILLPRRLVFVLDVDQLYAKLWMDRDDLPLVHRRLADVLWRSRHRNFARVQSLHGVFAAGVVLLGVDIVLWGVALMA